METTSHKTKIQGYSACIERTTTKTSPSRWRLRRWPELLAKGFLRRQWDTSQTNITKSGSPAATRRLHFGEDAERPFGTPAEALMRGYGAAQQVIDG
jgi:hypothetical protein